jgi:hypothetical protein
MATVLEPADLTIMAELLLIQSFLSDIAVSCDNYNPAVCRPLTSGEARDQLSHRTILQKPSAIPDYSEARSGKVQRSVRRVSS